MTELARCSVFIVDDHPVVRDGISQLLVQKGFAICGEADGGADALRLAAVARPDVFLIDLSLGEESGLDLIAALPLHQAKILVYSMHTEANYIQGALAAGAHGYATKREIVPTLVEAISAILAGERYLSPLAAQALAGAQLEPSPVLPGVLSEREREVFLLLGKGYTSTELTERFGVSYSTVQTYYARMMEKLSIDGMKELRRLAISLKMQ